MGLEPWSVRAALLSVRNAARVCAKYEERGRLDDWMLHGLRHSRKMALVAGFSEAEVAETIFAGLEQGRREAHEEGDD